MAENGLADLRFDGYGYDALADQLDGLRQGPGSESLFKAVGALLKIADGLAETDLTLRAELAKVGVAWQGAAADGGVAATQHAGVYASDAVPVVTQSARGVGEQGDSFSTTRNAAPEGKDLRGANRTTVWDDGLGLLGHTTDHAAEVQRTQAARQQAIVAMNNYVQGSQGALNNFQGLPVPPTVGVVTEQPPERGSTAVQGFSTGEGSFSPSGNSAATGGPSFAPPGSQSGFTGVAPPGGGPAPSVEFRPGGQAAPGVSSGPVPALGRVSGVGPVVSGVGGMPENFATSGGMRPGFSGQLMGEIATAAGIAGAGGAGAATGASLEQDRLARGGRPVNALAPGKQAGPVAEVPEEEAKAARNAEKLGGVKSGKQPSSLMQAAAGSGAEGEDEDEHVRKYGIDSEDLFGDERLVIAPVLGEDD
ncbi:PPE domain-containing protein [Actinokineospora inagensis]|uniref:PPE domain-containing protein n=1 Tax=Actinokineospora inagensis TaxID=103730 RepID=UPI0004119CCE|nr:PPE domain-containing protein [Actinokineospora inagensis]